MSEKWTRRMLFGSAGAAVAGSLVQQTGVAAESGAKAVKIIGVACSPRKDRATAAALKVCLAAAKAANPGIATELIDLGGLQIHGEMAAGIPLASGERDDFAQIEAKMRDPNVAGIIVGTPVYFSGMSSLCKAFLDRWMVFRKAFVLRNKVGGALAVGAARNGGQELTLQSIHAAMLCHDMVIVSEGRPTSRLGGILVSAGDDISKDETGIATAKSLGSRVAEVALLLRKAGA
jgi:multimeric flavodoxin WrbA